MDLLGNIIGPNVVGVQDGKDCAYGEYVVILMKVRHLVNSWRQGEIGLDAVDSYTFRLPDKTLSSVNDTRGCKEFSRMIVFLLPTLIGHP